MSKTREKIITTRIRHWNISLAEYDTSSLHHFDMAQIYYYCCPIKLR